MVREEVGCVFKKLRLYDFLSISFGASLGALSRYWILQKLKVIFNVNYIAISILNFSSGDRGIYSAIYNNQSPWYVSVFVGKKIYILKPLEKLTSNFKLTKKSINFSDDKNFKPGFRLQAKEVLNFFKKSSYNLSDYREYFKSVELINKIYK